MNNNKPFSLPDIQSLLDKDSIHFFGRTSEMLEKMKVRMSLVKEKWLAVKDYLLCRFFGFESTVDPITNLLVSVPDTQKVSISFVPNDFPYNVELDIEHWILWGLEKMDPEEVKLYLDSKMVDVDGKVVPYVSFVNPPETQSVRNLFHVHVLFKKYNKPSQVLYI